MLLTQFAAARRTCGGARVCGGHSRPIHSQVGRAAARPTAPIFASLGNFVPSGQTKGPAMCGGVFVVTVGVFEGGGESTILDYRFVETGVRNIPGKDGAYPSAEIVNLRQRDDPDQKRFCEEYFRKILPDTA